jgi:uncharacterized protein involved in exopolysaccharide biosynthesis
MRDVLRDPGDFLAELKARWPVVAGSCGVALVLALAVSLLLPKRYTATAEVLIQAPGSNDPRSATAISPAYLESLRVYEKLASSDSLFARAMEHVAGTTAARSSKKDVLRVSKPTNMAVLEISATMTDPNKAQALAQFIAEQTVEASRAIDEQSERDWTRESQGRLVAAKARLEETQREQIVSSGIKPVDGLEMQLQHDSDLLLAIENKLSDLRADAAAEKAGGDSRLQAALEAKIASLDKQREQLAAALAKKRVQLQQWRARADQLQADNESARFAVERAQSQFNEITDQGRFHGQRLRVIDPGAVPEQPSSPQPLLNVLAAVAFALLGSATYVAVSAVWRVDSRLAASDAPEALLSFRQ